MLKFAIAIAGCLLVASVCGAEETSSAAGNEPNVGDIMAFQQERHLKLWFAGRAGNWPLADYEIDKLKDGFDDVDKLRASKAELMAVEQRLIALLHPLLNQRASNDSQQVEAFNYMQKAQY